jgi:anti-sigma factor RsiW
MVMELVKHHLNCPIEISSDDPETLRAWFVQRDGGLGTDAPRLTASDYRLLGAHLCQMMHRNAAYMVYERGNVQISLCCVKNAPLELEGLDRVEAGRRQFYTTTYGGNHLVLWIDGDTLYAVIGPASRNDLLALAAETQRL